MLPCFSQIAEHYWDLDWSLQIYMVLLIPLLILLNLLRSLKYLTPFSMISNFLFITGVAISYYYIFQDLPSISERPLFSSVEQLPIFFGTTIFALEGVGVVSVFHNDLLRHIKRKFSKGLTKITKQEILWMKGFISQ